MKLMPADILRLRNDLITEVVDDQMVVLDLQENSYLGLNQVGRTVWEGLEAGQTFAAIVDAVVEQFQVDRATAESDAAVFIEELHERGFLLVDRS